MDRARLRALLASDSSIVFDSRAPLGVEKREDTKPFFEHPLLERLMLLKVIDSVGPDTPQSLNTLLYFPFDSNAVGDGGVSLRYTHAGMAFRIGRLFEVDLKDSPVIENDMKKLNVFGQVPSFTPFLLRDAFERAQLDVEKAFFSITDNEAETLRENLKAKLRPLAAMALEMSADMLDGKQLEILVRKLWQLDDLNFILPLARALRVKDDEALEVFYAWIGVAYFQTEFEKRKPRLKQLATWLASEAMPVEFVPAPELAVHNEARLFVANGLRNSWNGARMVFQRYTQSYDAIVSGERDAKPFVEFLKTVKADFWSLGEKLAVVEQCVGVLSYWKGRIRNDRFHYDILRQIVGSMRDVTSDASRLSAKRHGPRREAAGAK